MSDRFPTTHWSVVLSAGGADDSTARRALATLCEAYWFPLYAYTRVRGNDPETAQDLVQGYLTELIERHILRDVHPHGGRFRAFLLHTMKHFLVNEGLRRSAIKRGGGRTFIEIDPVDLEERYGRVVAETRTPEREYERQWALTVIERVLARLEREAEKNGRSREFARLRGFLTDGCERGDYDTVARDLSMSPGTARVAVHRLRRRFGQFLREEIADTVQHSGEVDDEVRSLFAAL